MTESMGYSIGQFRSVADEIKRLDAQANFVSQLEDQAFERLGLPHTGLCLDLGCGPGFIARRLRALRPDLRLLGVDLDQRALALAVQTLPCVRADARALPFGASTFDVAITRLMLRHIPEPERALAEMVRVVRPGGMVIVEDCDDGCLLIDPYPAGFAALLAAKHATVRRRGAEPYFARRLPALMRKSGLTSTEMLPLVVSTEGVGTEAFMRIVLWPAAEGIDPDLATPTAIDAGLRAIKAWPETTSAFGMGTLLVLRGFVA